MVSWGEAIAGLTGISNDIHNTLKAILLRLGGEPGVPGEPPTPTTPILSVYPRENKKELAASGITIINTRKGEVVLDDDSVEYLSASIPDEPCRSILIDSNARIDVTFLEGDKISLSTTIYPSKIRIHNLIFDTIKIKTTAAATIQLFISNVETPTIEDVSTSTNKPTLYTNNKNVTNHGTAEQLPTKTIPDGYAVVIKAKRSNTGYIYPGESKTQAEVHNVELSKNDAFSVQVDNINDIWIDSSVDGEGIEIFVEAEE